MLYFKLLFTFCTWPRKIGIEYFFLFQRPEAAHTPTHMKKAPDEPFLASSGGFGLTNIYLS
jgi:hypothetical protein